MTCASAAPSETMRCVGDIRSANWISWPDASFVASWCRAVTHRGDGREGGGRLLCMAAIVCMSIQPASPSLAFGLKRAHQETESIGIGISRHT